MSTQHTRHVRIMGNAASPEGVMTPYYIECHHEDPDCCGEASFVYDAEDETSSMVEGTFKPLTSAK